jgi:putative phage-type endonuclease
MTNQGTPEWLAERLGCVTASRISNVLSKGKGGGESLTRKKYLYQIIAERLSNEPQESYKSASMQWGTETEPLAKLAYESETCNFVTDVGFIKHPTIEWTGASPDGLVNDDGLIEIKCPNTSTHIETLLNETIDNSYIYQMQWQMECSGRQWCDFVSYDPRVGEKNSLKIIRVNRDVELIETIKKSLIDFLGEVDAIIKKLKD